MAAHSMSIVFHMAESLVFVNQLGLYVLSVLVGILFVWRKQTGTGGGGGKRLD